MTYQPELGQAAFGAPYGEWDVSPLGSGAIAHVLREIERVYWNRTGKEISFDSEDDADRWAAFGSEVEWHPYWWGEDDAPEASRPNLSFRGYAFRWYKHPGRGESADQEMTPDEWHRFLNAILPTIRAVDVESLR